MRRSLRWTVVALLSALACSGSDSPTHPVTSDVTTVDVSPGTATMNVGEVLQLAAIARDAQGAVVTGVTVAWSSSATAVARVSNSGAVTAVSGGSAIVTATASGKSGQAIVMVSAVADYGPVVAQADVGAAGGTVGNADIGVTIPAGAWSGTNTIRLIRDTVSENAYADNSASERYFIDGLPSGVGTQARIRIKASGTNQGAAAIGLLRPAFQFGESEGAVMGLTVIAATDSAGHLVATVPLRGRTSWTGGPALRNLLRPMAARRASAIDPEQLKADAELSGLMNLTHVVSSSNHFDLWGFGGGADVAAKVEKTSALAEQSWTTLTGMGYDLSFRAAPIPTYVLPMTDNGLFTLIKPWPLPLENGYLSYNRRYVDNAEYPGVVIHELFHLTKSALFPTDNWGNLWPTRWLDEATSTWVQERHPLIAQPYSNAVARWLRDSLFTGLSSGMVGWSGYGKAPMIKYISKRWGDARVKAVLDLVHGGMTPISGFLAGIAEPPSQWWPDLLNQYMSGTLYPWTVAELVPGHWHNVNLELGDTPAWTTGAMFPLGVEAEFLQRDTAMFGPNFSLPVYLDSRDIGFAKILAYQKSAASATFTPLAAGDTVRIAGAVLQRRDTILLLLTPTAPVAPYTTTRAVRFVTDLRVPEGDWYISTLANLNDGITFTCSKPGDSVSMNATDNVKSVLTFLSGAGTWKKTASGTLKSVTHTWSATPAYADTLRKYNVTLTSTLVTGTRGDTIKLHADLRFNLASALRGDSGAVPPPAYGWWWLVPAGALTLALRRRTRRMALFASGISLLVLVGCEIGQISFLMDESFDFTFTKMRFTADPARPADPLMQVTAGAGRTVMNSFRSEYWDYTTNVSGGRDSTRVTCTGAGTATYAVDATAFTDGTAPPASNLMESLAGLLRTTPDELRARMNRR